MCVYIRVCMYNIRHRKAEFFLFICFFKFQPMRDPGGYRSVLIKSLLIDMCM